MGHKSVCFNCKKAFSLGSDFTRPKHTTCPECKGEVYIYPHRFRPPRKTDNKAWELIQFLSANGFYFQHIYQENSGELFKKLKDNYVSYPKNLREAKDFIEKYKRYAIK